MDVVCAGRLYDFFARRRGCWGIVRRQPIYEEDRMDPIDPAARSRACRGSRRAPFSLEKMSYEPVSGTVIYRSRMHKTLKRNF